MKLMLFLMLLQWQNCKSRN